jgi:hypothetical protein
LLGMGCDQGGEDEQERNGEALGFQREPPGTRNEYIADSECGSSENALFIVGGCAATRGTDFPVDARRSGHGRERWSGYGRCLRLMER